MAERESISPIPLLRCLANEHSSASAAKIHRLADLLDSGDSVDQALEQMPELLTDEQVLKLRFATESGSLSSAFATLSNERDDASAELYIRPIQSLFYCFVVCNFCLWIFSLLLTFIAPTFKEMYEEFGLELPPMFIAVVHAGDVLAGFVLPAAGALLLLTVLMIWVIRPIRLLRRFVLSRISPSVTRLRSAKILSLLSETVREGKPLAGAFSTLARYHYDSHIRGKLLFVRNEIEQGADPWLSMAKVRLLSANEADSIARATDNDLRAWLLEQLACKKELKSQSRFAFVAVCVHPILILIMAFFVACISIGFFSILPNLITSLA